MSTQYFVEGEQLHGVRCHLGYLAVTHSRIEDNYSFWFFLLALPLPSLEPQLAKHRRSPPTGTTRVACFVSGVAVAVGVGEATS